MSTNGNKPFFTEEQKALIAEHILKGAPEYEVERFLITCERTQLDPFSRQIYGRVQNRKVKVPGGGFKWVPEVIIMTSIDGLRAIAERTGEYRGQTHPEWYSVDHDKGGSAWMQVWVGRDPQTPDAARVGVYRQGFPEPVYGVARYLSYVQFAKDNDDGGGARPTPFWRKMPDVMLSKCAEAIALRKAFPLLLSGLFIEEEVSKEPEDETSNGEEQKPAAPVTPAETVVVAPVVTKPAPTPAPEQKPPAPEQKPSETAAPAPEGGKRKGGRKKPAAAAEAPAPAPTAPPTEEVYYDADKDGEGDASAEDTDATDTATPREPWRDYTICQITIPKFAGRKLSELTPADIASLQNGWVVKYADKIKLNAEKVREAEMITAAFESTSPQ